MDSITLDVPDVVMKSEEDDEADKILDGADGLGVDTTPNSERRKPVAIQRSGCL